MKVGANKEHQSFVQIVNSTIRDKKISLKARGLLSFMLSYPSDWDFSLDFLVKETGEKITSTRTEIQELIENGYLQRVRHTNSNGKVICWEYIIYETNNSDDWVI